MKILICAACGKPYSERACGLVHASIQSEREALRKSISVALALLDPETVFDDEEGEVIGALNEHIAYVEQNMSGFVTEHEDLKKLCTAMVDAQWAWAESPGYTGPLLEAWMNATDAVAVAIGHPRQPKACICAGAVGDYEGPRFDCPVHGGQS